MVNLLSHNLADIEAGTKTRVIGDTYLSGIIQLIIIIIIFFFLIISDFHARHSLHY